MSNTSNKQRERTDEVAGMLSQAAKLDTKALRAFGAAIQALIATRGSTPRETKKGKDTRPVKQASGSGKDVKRPNSKGSASGVQRQGRVPNPLTTAYTGKAVGTTKTGNSAESTVDGGSTPPRKRPRRSEGRDKSPLLQLEAGRKTSCPTDPPSPSAAPLTFQVELGRKMTKESASSHLGVLAATWNDWETKSPFLQELCGGSKEACIALIWGYTVTCNELGAKPRSVTRELARGLEEFKSRGADATMDLVRRELREQSERAAAKRSSPGKMQD
jgi:hypothetical protein